MIAIILGVVAVVALVAFIAFNFGANRAAKSFAAGSPTPAEAQIKTETQQQLEQSAASAATDEQKVQNASKSDLLSLARSEMWPDPAPSDAGKPSSR